MYLSLADTARSLVYFTYIIILATIVLMFIIHLVIAAVLLTTNSQ